MNELKINFRPNFGKQALMECNIKEKTNQNKHEAVLYKLNPEDSEDRKDVFYSRQTGCIAEDFNRELSNFYPQKEFYIIQNNDNGEVVSFVEISHHYRPNNLSHTGQYTLIEAAKENEKYVNGIEPLFAFIAKHAATRYDEAIFTAFDEETLPSLKSNKFSKTQTGDFYIPEKKFVPLIEQAEKRYQIEYLV